jgi:molecular chaperone GrpE
VTTHDSTSQVASDDPATGVAAESSPSEVAPATESESADAGPEIGALSVEALLSDLENVSAERDGYLDDLQRVQAEFQNFRRQVDKRNSDVVQQAAANLVDKLLPVLDSCDAALAHGASEVEPVATSLLEMLRKEGLEPIDQVDEPFDPAHHEAVAHEPGEGPEVVAEVLRTGYLWKGRVLRPAMVKVRG